MTRNSTSDSPRIGPRRVIEQRFTSVCIDRKRVKELNCHVCEDTVCADDLLIQSSFLVRWPEGLAPAGESAA